jgi:hypothetical protein
MNVVRFVDTRCDAPVLNLSIEGNTVHFHSPYICNDKYSKGNSDYNTRKTTNLANARRWLVEYVRPFTSSQIAGKCINAAIKLVEEWKKDADYFIYQTRCGFDTTDVLEDMINYCKTGIPYQTPKLAKYTTQEFLASLEAAKARSSVAPPMTHVLVNPDDAVEVNRFGSRYCPSDVVFSGMFDTLDESYRAKIALLKMSDKKTFVPDVGVQLDEYNFWVY